MIAHEARRMLRAHRYGALGTLSKKYDGYPFGSITPYLVDQDGSLLILISNLAEHTKNILRDDRVSLITHDQRDPQIQSQGRVTVIGNAAPEPNREQAGSRYLRYFPEALDYLAMHDFSFFRIRPIAIRFIGGFGNIHWVDMKNYSVTQAETFTKNEEALLAEANTLHHAILQKIVWGNRGPDQAEVWAIGLDCDGMDVCSGERIWRLDFPEAVSNPSLQALKTLKMRG